jgi:diaminohydroxyphosphoribosylaminopyrimidine deaminase/5-amino-6-(5-phosphoribosylamino)uracil reductase
VPTTLVARTAEPRRRDALVGAGVDVRVYETLQDALAGFAADGVRSLLVEGGARLAGSLLEAGVVDRLVIFQAPVVLGAAALNAFAHVSSATAASLARLPVIERVALGDDLKTTFALGAA